MHRASKVGVPLCFSAAGADTALVMTGLPRFTGTFKVTLAGLPRFTGTFKVTLAGLPRFTGTFKVTLAALPRFAGALVDTVFAVVALSRVLGIVSSSFP
jgi:hypothetical protein